MYVPYIFRDTECAKLRRCNHVWSDTCRNIARALIKRPPDSQRVKSPGDNKWAKTSFCRVLSLP
jgi:hypothetical protein